MRTTRAHWPLLLLAIALSGFVGCASDGPTFEIPADTANAPQASLESLFDQISTQLSAAKPGSSRATRLEAQRRTVGHELATRAADSVRARLAQVERVDGKIPANAIERDFGGHEDIERWDADVYAALASELQKESDSTRSAIQTLEDRLSATAEDDVRERVLILSELGALSGAGSEDQIRYAQQSDAILSEVSKKAEEAIQNEDYEKAQGLLGIVQEVKPEDDQARSQKCDVDAKVLVKRFSESLETGRIERSTEMLTEFSKSDCFDEVKDQLAGSARPIADAFGSLAQEAASAGDLELAYQRYGDAAQVQDLLLGGRANLPGIQSFLAKVDKAYKKAFAAGEFGLALGCLDVMTEFGPTTPKLRQRIRQTRDEVSRRAVHGLTAYPFSDSPTSAAKVGDAVASKVVQYIFQTIPNDVRIVEREQLERILEECERNGNCGDLDTADFIIQGSILDAKVETTEKKGRETLRVITGNEAVVNPDHVRWSQMSDRDRKKTVEPPRTVNRDVTEDVSMEVTNVRKVGIISVSYRVIEANSGRVLFTDSIQTKQEFQDEGRQGVRLGNFQQETDFVELPPDIEILSGNNGLADKISE